MRVLAVFDHPRRDSFCGAVLDNFTVGLNDAGHEVEVADLYREGFDPRMPPEDEPDWADGKKRYSAAVLKEQERIDRHDAIALLFPVWWWSLPAMSKGWIDRVWNNGWAYGERKLPHQKAVFLAIASSNAESYAKRGYDRSLQIGLEQGVLNYCGVANAKLQLLFGSLAGEKERQALLAQAGDLGRHF